MTVYQCDSCDGEHPGGAQGTCFLVLPNGRTNHFCSRACLRAYVNSQPTPDKFFTRLGMYFLFIGGALFGAFIHYLTHLSQLQP